VPKKREITPEGRDRYFPYIWPTWIAGLVSGDRQCWWAAWFRAHRQDFETTRSGNENRLSQWKAEHADFVRDTADRMVADGWTVTVEDQNKLDVRGEIATVGAKPDIVAEVKPPASLIRAIALPEMVEATIVDCKTGRPRESDYWQVVTYVSLATLKGARLYGKRVSGAVVYRDHERPVSPQYAAAGAPNVWAAVKTVGGSLAPPRTPSAL
jgi:hypothetical protein